ncbi:methionyl-tRNA formyltransferase [Clostridium sporogenes]|uniref:Methionyl-tRNA formyltransferase n=1 Tax=Clostridium botulinum TaxID=1491 RepID=A0A6M0SZI8_CLOBO|nr:formyltransferase family protein [Clostridium sporogenes]NFA59982.1 methionyl-tRNA formyltransferase [Clostridium botulinum]NFI73698.1 methionyl-tRNA formyltransferase [Clostridium sporogenes]NFL72192.1 methionyl-tRNA formyltransferase [Clostridium sporogenes]NFM23878.1 methionyl-tRNA formyltransferase [Clostridium sporogenes]NFP61572.1 methionyl-tRNA formyltransferase [Clostridium sporogenes]
MKIIIATIKSWNVKNADKFRRDNDYEHDVFIITNKDDLTYEKVSEINPEYIFLPHWSWIIPKEIYETFNCIVFHMTDLPFGRGGSPLQNLIERGIENTKISAIKVNEGIDTGDIYFKESLNLNGTADEIFIRASQIIFKKMISRIINEKILPKKQSGGVIQFKRRNFSQSEILSNFDLGKIYDYIRMLDGEEYPKAFIKFGKYKLEFSRASLKNNKIIADVEIIDEDG